MADSVEEEQDVQLQKSAKKLLAEIQNALPSFLRKTSRGGQRQIKRQVRVRDTDALVALLEPFQELPQLLDPHLNEFVPLLAQAFLDALQAKCTVKVTSSSPLLTPLTQAICRLLYTFCKIRGEKVVVLFLSTETRHIELLLSAIEAGTTEVSSHPTARNADVQGHHGVESEQVCPVWEWEERYIALLWLSQLLLVPFDLASISSGNVAISLPAIQGLVWPTKIPMVTLRVISLAIKHLSSAGKERNSAKVLLVRVATRRDMQELGILRALVNWAISYLQRRSSQSMYHHIGILSFLAGALVSSNSTADMDPYLRTIFSVVHSTSTAEGNAVFNAVNSSAVARKTIIKVFRMISVLLLRRPMDMASAEMVELTIDHMLCSLKDSATPVRFAASKALSLITLKLPLDMAEQVIEAVLQALKQKVLHRTLESDNDQHLDLSAVNPLEWHGLNLTLSHLLYHRSPPPTSLSRILAALVRGLSFEQRSSSGSSIGTNVRDAANFGIWAAARRYSTAELQAVSLNSDSKVGNASPIQMLATALVVSASLDPAGNIRRGSSAALQELIGRHPDTIAEGIKLVQVVDYHAVARRTHAAQKIALEAGQLSPHYLNALLESCFGWRGVADGDAIARRAVAEAFGDLVWTLMVPCQDWSRFCNILSRIERRTSGIMKHQFSELHGLLLCLSSMLGQLQPALTINNLASEKSNPVGLRSAIEKIKALLVLLLQQAKEVWFGFRRPELIAEAISKLLIVTYPVLRADNFLSTTERENRPALEKSLDFNRKILDIGPPRSPKAHSQATEPSKTVPSIKSSQADQVLLHLMQEVLERKVLFHNEEYVLQPASLAALSHITALNSEQRDSTIDLWARSIQVARGGHGFISAVLLAWPSLSTAMQAKARKAIAMRWTNHPEDIDTKRAILSCLVLASTAHSFLDLIEEGVDDYTTNARGDVGSLLRIEAVKVAGVICKNHVAGGGEEPELFKRLFGKVLRLAAEKLDKVRAEGKIAVCGVLDEGQAAIFSVFSTSSIPYFSFLLCLTTSDSTLKQLWDPLWQLEVMQGLVTSANTGSEDLVRVTRTALVDFCQITANQHIICTSLKTLLEKSNGYDRILIPVMETLGFLLDYGVVEDNFEPEPLYHLVQRAHYKTKNIRRLEAAIRLYGCLVVNGYTKAYQGLSGFLLHPMPLIRNQAADTLFSVTSGIGRGVNWTTAKRADVESLRKSLIVS